MTSLRTRLLLLFLGFAGLALLLSAAGTATVLHAQSLASLDQTLMAAALAEAHPWQEERYENEYVHSLVSVVHWDDTQPQALTSAYEQAVASERPVWTQEGGRRVLLLSVEPEGHPVDHEHAFMVASAPSVHLRQTVGPFLLTYLGTASLALAVAWALLSVALTAALGPLERASKAISLVGALDAKARLPLDGPPEVRALLEATNQLLERLETAFLAQVGFTSQAAHELRTPITVLKGEVDLALRRPRTVDEYKGVIERLGVEFERLHALVEGLLMLARVDSGQVEQGKTTERVSHPVHLALQQERQSLEAAGCTMTVALDDDPEIPMHVALLTSAVATLLRNAAAHAPGSTVAVSTQRVGGCVQIQIRDDGPGIADPETMLQRFHGTSDAGLGLGLPIAREIARRHGGELGLEGKRGTTAVLSVPM